ncbi:hypothetical protein [Qipengyuania marisflavi]|uniref:DUF2927 domain-containing protein n=1 Tax=Qipengyuania marisflavi TaxID=2486356 RepID=A0A5S3P907_9SPHN|nr:hypothetical protein [Qipengyuania marisflavi]TMM49992.1 hypothetical protein FEV51_01985 [Qipengyuania marisflavi]
MSKFLAIILAAAVAYPVQAQQVPFPESDLATGTRFKRLPENVARDESRMMQKRIVKCSVYRNKDLARQILINSDPVTIDFVALDVDKDDLMDELDISDCIGRSMKNSTYRMQMRFQYQTLRALMAEEVYLMDFNAPPAPAATAGTAVSGRSKDRLVHPRAEQIAGLADCLVFHGPAAADALLRSTIASDAEHEAIEALYPALQSCGMNSTEEVVLDYSMVRQVIADGLWTRSHYGDEGSPQASEDDA